MDTDEAAIRTLVTRWAAAAHAGDLATVLADHAPDIVMFDVPPPQQGVRGIEAYQQTWPPFFDWQSHGAILEIVELDVTAGADVAFAYALLRCGMPNEIGDQRLRLTLGLRKERGRWIVEHEHHSLPTPAALTDAHPCPSRNAADQPRRPLLRDPQLVTPSQSADCLTKQDGANVHPY